MSNIDRPAVVSAEIARLLHKERVRQGLSVYRVAKLSGISGQMIHYVERGMRNPTLDTLLRITAALDLDLAALIKRAVRSKLKAASQSKHRR